jgi:hypothetical protein
MLLKGFWQKGLDVSDSSYLPNSEEFEVVAGTLKCILFN